MVPIPGCGLRFCIVSKCADTVNLPEMTMMKGEVIVAGCGVGAACFAIRALQLGLKPILIRVPMPSMRGVEVIPASAARLLEALELGEVLANLGVGLGEGMQRRWADGTTDTTAGRSMHVERQALRAGVLAEALRRGARIQDADELPRLDPASFSVDATGQHAAWSRPVFRRGKLSADIFMAEGRETAAGTGRLALMDRGWAYLAADQAVTSIGVVGRHRRAPTGLDPQTCEALGLSSAASFRFVGRRPAFVQWTSKPVDGRRLAIGDAAVHHNPIGGRGISFALGSAFAAASVFATWQDDPALEDGARAYYEGFVAAELRKHLGFLDGDGRSVAPEPPVPAQVRWIAPSVRGEMALDSRVVPGEVFVLASGTSIRWAGSFDLIRLRDIMSKTVSSEKAVERLCDQGLTVAEARRTLAWALANGLIAQDRCT